MTVQNETKWLLQVIQENYPMEWPGDLVRRNRDDSITLDKDNSPVKEEGVELTNYNAISVATGSVNRELYGQTPQYRVEHELDVRVEGLSDYEHGQIGSDDEFKSLVAYVQNAINQEIKYPAVDTGTEDIGRVVYLDLSIVNESSLMADAKDYYRVDFTVRLRGNANP